jgi:hypothetical protein
MPASIKRRIVFVALPVMLVDLIFGVHCGKTGGLSSTGVLLRRLPALFCRALHMLFEKLRDMYAVYKSFLAARFRGFRRFRQYIYSLLPEISAT